MKILRKTFLTVSVSLFSIMLFCFLTVIFAAACSDKVTMSFETFGGTKIEAISLSSGSEVTAPENPEKEGYVFVGWYLDKNCEGESTQLPDTMPSQSVTYYAKFEQYPTLTLDLNGGVLDKTVYYVKEGTNLCAFLSDIVPEKEGLAFQEWQFDGEALAEDAVMPETDVALTAQYIASYRVEVLLQSASSRTQFDVAESYDGTEREGAVVSAQIPSYDHFYFDETQSTAAERTLSAGENVIRFVFMRENVLLQYISLDGVLEETVTSYYGGSVMLKEGACNDEEYIFFGWMKDDGAAAYFAGEEFIMGAEDIALYAVRAKTYTDGRGSSAILAVAECENGDGTQSARLLDGAKAERGLFNAADDTFLVGDTDGRLDGRGNFLLSDSGSYAGYSLAANKADEELYGSLTLDFKTGTALLNINGETVEGSYTYLYDEELQRYTGKYTFIAQSEEVLFLIDGDHFLKEGEEKGLYYYYDCLTGEYDVQIVVMLDGFGGAVYASGGVSISGTYCGGGTDEWLLTSENGVMRLMTGVCGPAFGGNSKSVAVFLIYRADWAGSFVSGAGETLTLDGYGFSAIYRTAEGEEDGVFTVEGNTVSFKGTNAAYTFTINRGTGSFSMKTAQTLAKPYLFYL